jgi:hypothetical protein
LSLRRFWPIIIAIAVVAVMAAGCISNNEKVANENNVSDQQKNSPNPAPEKLPVWQINITTKKDWTLYKNADGRIEETIEGTGNRIISGIYARNITLEALTSSRGDPISLQLIRKDGTNELYEDSGTGAAAVSNEGKAKRWRPITLVIDDSYFRSDIGITQEMLINNISSMLLSAGYRIDDKSDRVDKLTLQYKEDISDDEWRTVNDPTAPSVRGTDIKCHYDLKDAESGSHTKGTIFARTQNRVPFRNPSDPIIIRMDLYHSAFVDFANKFNEIIGETMVDR